MKTIAKKELMIHASGEFLTDELPDNFRDLTELELLEYIETHVWEAFEDTNPNDVLDLISSSADGLEYFLESKGIYISDK